MSAVTNFLLTYLLNSLWLTPVCFLAATAMAGLLRQSRPVITHRVWVGALAVAVAFPALPAPHWSWHTAGATAGVSVSFGPATAAGASGISGGALDAVAAAYAAVMVLFAIRLLWGGRRTAALVRGARAVALPAEQALVWHGCCERFGVTGARLLETAAVQSPFTWGGLRRVVVVPAGLLQRVTAAELEALLAHECAHMRRRDFLLNLLYEALLLPLAYHPVARLLRSRLVESREWICDAAAAQVSGSPVMYARSLLRLAALLLRARPATVPHAIGVLDANALERRVMRMTRPLQTISVVRRVGLVVGCGVLGAATCASAWALRTGVRVPVAALPQQNSGGGAAEPVRISGAVMAAQRLGGSHPEYPPDARAAGIQGAVVLSAQISPEGNIENLSVVSGPKELQQSAIDAVKDWTYKPFTLNGEPVAVSTTITVNYNLAP